MSSRAAVVGAGIVGLSVGWFLQEQGFDVTVFDAIPTDKLVTATVAAFRAASVGVTVVPRSGRASAAASSTADARAMRALPVNMLMAA